MAKIGKIKGKQVGTLTFQEADQIRKPRKFDVKLTKEIIPFDMTGMPRRGWPTELCATSLLWSSSVSGVVLKDRDSRFHAIETDQSRAHLGDHWSFSPSIGIKGFDLVRFVSLPIFDFQAINQSKMAAPNECFIESRLTTHRPKSKAMRQLQTDIQETVKHWDGWWLRFVSGKRNPPPPPDDIKKSFVELTGLLFEISPSDIGVLKGPDDSIPDKLVIDLYDRSVRGLGGSNREDLDKRLREIKSGKLPVILQIQAEAFRGALPMLGVQGTGIHEGGHYRHFVLTGDLLRQWHKSKGRGNRKENQVALTQSFGQFVDKQVKDDHISRVERTIVHSTFGVTPATHPIAQMHAFMGMYAQYPRERDTRIANQSFTGQMRFLQLLQGAGYWRDVTNPDIKKLCVKAIADFAKHRDTCTTTDLRGLIKEITTAKHHGGKKFFMRLEPQLPK